MVTTEVVRQAYATEVERWGLTFEEALEEFDAWLTNEKGN